MSALRLPAALVALLLLFLPGLAPSREGQPLSVCYVPFNMETFDPTTVENIEQRCFANGEPGHRDRNYVQLMAILTSAASGPFDEQFVRAKIARPDADPIFIDRNGGILDGATSRRLDALAFASVTTLIEGMTQRRFR